MGNAIADTRLLTTADPIFGDADVAFMRFRWCPGTTGIGGASGDDRRDGPDPHGRDGGERPPVDDLATWGRRPWRERAEAR